MSKIIYNNIIPFKGFVAINICGIIFARKTYKHLSTTTINHEEIHTLQIKELYYIGFYILYVLEWIYKLFKYGNSKDAYYYISFEREAYCNQYNLEYIKNRPKFNFKKYFI